MGLKNLRIKKTSQEHMTTDGEDDVKIESHTSPVEMTHVTKRLSMLSPKSLAIVGVIIVILLMLASLPAYYFYNQYQSAQQRAKDPTIAAEEQVKSVTTAVGKLLLLPTGEAPTLATVSDKSKLVGQQFFANAQNGDKVLIYTNAKKAILYRPSSNKIIEVGPINITGEAGVPNAQVAGAKTTATPTPAIVRVGLLNGTTVVGLTKKIETSLIGKLPFVQVTVKDNAVKSDYAQTLVIPSSTAHKAAAEQIAKELGGKVATLPAGEVAQPDTEITVILGQNSSQ